MNNPSMNMKSTCGTKLEIMLAGVLALVAASAKADTFGSGGNAFVVDFVNIGNAGNGDDLGAGGGLYSSPYGGVTYNYRMGVTEVPQAWIDKATNLGFANVTAGPWIGSQPATQMTWSEMAAFVNWLNTSTGHHAAYQLDAGNTTPTLWTSAEAWQVGGENLYRHQDAYYFLPSEDEWYKAAYHKNDGITANYWDYATGSNSIPMAIQNGTNSETAVYLGVPAPADVENNGGLSPYGTRGQNGNTFELLESALDGTNDDISEFRGVRGGAFSNSESSLRASNRSLSVNLIGYSNLVGFRIASVPEPSCVILIIGGGLVSLVRRRR